jgi:DNA-binding SARP family transcriptional activator
MPFRLLALGELSLYASDQERKLAVPRKGLALLAILASAGGRGVPREKVASLLWPDSEDAGRGALKQTIYELRQTLGNHSAVLGTGELTLDPAEITSDVGELEAAHARKEWTRVAELYGGPFLDRFHVRGAAEFDHWVDAHRDRYRGMFRDALEKSARAATQAGEHQAAAAIWRRLAAEDPFNSRIAIGLIEALALAGDPAGALTHYRVHEQLLREELGTRPDAALTAAAENIRAGAARARRRLETGATSEAAEAHAARGEQASVPAPPASVGVAPSPERVTRRAGRRVWPGVLLLLVIAGGLAAAWRERDGARVVASIALAPNSASRVVADLNLRRIYVEGGASFDHALTVINADNYSSRLLPHGAGAAADPITGWIWSGDYGGRFVVVRNGHTGAEIDRVKVPGCPHHIAIDGRRAWIAQQCDDHISAIDNRTRKVIRDIPIPTLSRKEVSGAKGMGEILVNRATGIVYFWKDMIPHRLDPGSWDIREVSGIDGPIIGVNEPMNRLYARVDNGLQVIDGTTEKVEAHVQLPATPAHVAIGFGGKRVYVATASGLAAVDGERHRVLWAISFDEGFLPYGVAADDGRRRVYVLGVYPDGRRVLKVLRLRD